MALTGLLAANNLSDVVDIERTWDNIGNNISATVFVPSPTLDLNFAANKSLVDSVSGNNLITFARASTGTFVGSNGLIQTAASGVPRFDHNGATGESLGLLVEEARTNLLPYSENLSLLSSNAITVTADSTVPSPTGSFNVYRITSTSATSLPCVYYTTDPSGYGTWSAFFKAGTSTTVAISLGFAFTDDGNYAIFTLTGTGSVSAVYGTGKIQQYGNGWYLCSYTYQGPMGFNTFRWGMPFGTAVGQTVYMWGLQLEVGTFGTSYIPTSGSTVTRAADIASITGSNFSSWFAQNGQFTIYSEFVKLTNNAGGTYAELFRFSSGIGVQRRSSTTMNWQKPGADWVQISSMNDLNSSTVKTRLCSAVANNIYTLASSPGIVNGTHDVFPVQSSIQFAYSPQIASNACSTLSRITYYPVRLPDRTLQAFASSGVSSSFPYSFSIKGKDILALKQVNRASTRDFIFIKGLTSNAQARITTASQYTASGVALRNVAMLKTAPTTIGNYFFSSGLTLSGTTVQINGTPARSIATSPFSGSTATSSLLFAGLRPQANWRITEPMASGTISSPEIAIPIETNDFLLFMKAGQS
jgi:hypothetical protein